MSSLREDLGHGGYPPKRKERDWNKDWYAHKDPTIPRIHWLVLGPDNPLAQAGMRAEGCCIHFEKAQAIFQDVGNMLSEVTWCKSHLIYVFVFGSGF